MDRLTAKTHPGAFGALAFWAGFLVWMLIASAPPRTAAQTPGDAEEVGVPWTGSPAVVESVSNIMARDKHLPLQSQMKPGQGDEGRLLPNLVRRTLDPASATLQGSPGLTGGPLAGTAGLSPFGSQSVGVSFLGAQVSESGFIPPDSQAAVGPTQVLLCVNGRIKVFDKTGALGALNTTTGNFFSSQTSNRPTDPHVRYDRLSGRWFVIMVDVPSSKKNNRVLIAVSSGATITDSTSFSFFSFVHSSVSGGGDNGDFADYPTLGIDPSALYVGANIFSGNSFAGTTGYVINKSNLLAGTLTVTAFRQLTTSKGHGPSTPQGVDNDDPSATQGFFIGIDNTTKGRLVIRRVSNPGGVPSISANLNLTVPATDAPVGGVEVLGSSTPLDAVDDRLFAARMHKGSLWTAHNIQVDNTGVADPLGTQVGSRWYEITNLTATPGLRQSGTLFDPASSNPANYWIPSCTMNGQGHMVLGCSVGGFNERAEIAVTGRLATDPLGALQPPTVVQTSSSDYNLSDNVNPHRWGDFSLTTVDPNDDMTFWTVQEYCNAVDSWGVRIIQIKAPPPAIPSICNPASIVGGTTNVDVTLTGVSTNGSGFFDPGPDFQNHISAAVNGGGVVVNHVTFTDPTHVTLNLDLAPTALAGLRTLSVTNPDGQFVTSAASVFTVLPNPNTNHPPSLSTLSDLSIEEDTISPPVAFSIGDLETAAISLHLSDSSSNTNLITEENIFFTGTGSNRSLTLAPLLDQSGTATITLTVIDGDGATASRSFLLTVLPVNHAPVLAQIPDRKIHQGAALVVTNTATDKDLPPNLLTYGLSNAPPGAAIDSASGVFTWTPAPELAKSTNLITVVVTDNGLPPLSDAKTFAVVVVSPPAMSSTVSPDGTVSLSWTAIPGTQYRVQYKANLNEAAWSDLTGDVTASAETVAKTDTSSNPGQRFYRIIVLP